MSKLFLSEMNKFFSPKMNKFFSSKMAKISVVIPTFNSQEFIAETLESILKQTIPIYEIILIDNNSSDKTVEKVLGVIKKNQTKKIKLVSNKKNLGVTGGRNSGITNLSKNIGYILFFDHDMVADIEMVKNLLKIFKEKPQAGIVTPKIFYSEDHKKIWSAGTGINLWTGQIYFRGGVDSGQFDEVCEVQVAPASFLVKREVLKKVKKFDDRFFATYEDTDFCFRALKSGYKTYYSPEAVAFHKIPLDAKKEAERLLERAYWVGRNRVLFMRSFGKNFLVFLFFIPLFSLYYLKLAVNYNTLSSWVDFLKGTFDGLRNK